jgi:hypothetical protein
MGRPFIRANTNLSQKNPTLIVAHLPIAQDTLLRPVANVRGSMVEKLTANLQESFVFGESLSVSDCATEVA